MENKCASEKRREKRLFRKNSNKLKDQQRRSLRREKSSPIREDEFYLESDKKQLLNLYQNQVQEFDYTSCLWRREMISRGYPRRYNLCGPPLPCIETVKKKHSSFHVSRQTMEKIKSLFCGQINHIDNKRTDLLLVHYW